MPTQEADSFSATSNPLPGMIRSLEHDVATTLALLRRRVNAYESGVYRLPPEVLSLVASHLPKEDLIKATHVSHRWRTILLAFPRLWANLNLNCKPEALTFLERSKSAPISVCMNVEGHFNFTVWIMFLRDNATRIETLAISGLYIYPPAFLSFAECLRRLDLSLGDTDGHNHAVDDRMDIRLSLPNLVVLTIRGGDTFPFDFPQLSQLQVYPTRKLAMDKLLHFLSRCPLLKELEVGCDQGVTTRGDDNVIKLPHLRFYSHHTNSYLHPQLFDKLCLPSSCSVVFNYWNGSTDIRQAHVGIPFYNPSPLADIKRINLKAIDQKEGSVDATVELVDTRGHRVCLMKNVGQSRPDGQFLVDPRAMDDLYVAYLKGLDTSTVDVLCASGIAPWAFDTAWELLSCLGEIRTLVLSGIMVVASCLHALTQEQVEDDSDVEGDLDVEGGSNRGEWRCKKLKALVVHVESPYCNPHGEHVVEFVSHVAQERKGAGVPFKSVSLFMPSPWDEIECGPMESNLHLKRLKECVEDVKIVFGVGALDWDIDDYFFDGLSIRRDRYRFPEEDRYECWWKSTIF